MLTATVYMQFFRAIESGVSSVLSLNESLTTIHMTMDLTNQDMSKLATSAQNMAKEMGLSTDEVLNAFKIYANMNESISGILEKTKADIMLATASGMSTTDTTDKILSPYTVMYIE